MNAIEINHLSKQYDGFRLDNVSLILRYMMVFLTVSAILTVLTYWKSFFFAVLFAVMLFLLLPALLSTLFDKPILNSLVMLAEHLNWSMMCSDCVMGIKSISLSGKMLHVLCSMPVFALLFV